MTSQIAELVGFCLLHEVAFFLMKIHWALSTFFKSLSGKQIISTTRHCFGLWIQLAAIDEHRWAMFQTLFRTDCFKWFSWRRRRAAVTADALTKTLTKIRENIYADCDLFLHCLRCCNCRHGKSDGEELSKLILKEPDLWRRHQGWESSTWWKLSQVCCVSFFATLLQLRS